MRWDLWEPEYGRILREFRFSRSKDAAASRELETLLARHPRGLTGEVGWRRVARLLRGREVLVVGDGPGSVPHPRELWGPGRAREGRSIAADGATHACLEVGFVPDLISTDLDGSVEEEIEANARGSLVVIHAHADNREALARWVPRFPGPLVGSVPGMPGRWSFNVGGFTDGDRAIHWAEEAKARRVILAGFDFRMVRGKFPGHLWIKRRKLARARALIDALWQRGDVPVDLYTKGGTIPWPGVSGERTEEATFTRRPTRPPAGRSRRPPRRGAPRSG